MRLHPYLVNSQEVQMDWQGINWQACAVVAVVLDFAIMLTFRIVEPGRGYLLLLLVIVPVVVFLLGIGCALPPLALPLASYR